MEYQDQDDEIEEPKNIICCHFFIKIVYLFKESIVIFISTILGIVQFSVSLTMLTYIIPLNLVNTYGTQIKNSDLILNITLWLVSFNNLVMALHTITLTDKQKSCWKKICKQYIKKTKKVKQESAEIYKSQQERLDEMINSEKEGFCQQIGSQLYNPSKTYLTFIVMASSMNIIPYLGSAQLYQIQASKEIYAIYSGSNVRFTIDLVLKACIINGALGIISLISVMLFFFLSAIESCVITSCLPEFKGTYDENQDEVIAVDWTVGDERHHEAEKLTQEMKYFQTGSNSSNEEENEDSQYRRAIRERHKALNTHSEEYNLRLSKLRLTYEQLAQQYHAKFEQNISEFKQITQELPKECAVCMESFKPKSQIIGLDCNPFKHIFHWQCLLRWLKSQRSCPLCRKEIRYLLPRSIFYAQDLQIDKAEMQRYRQEVNINLHNGAQQ